MLPPKTQTESASYGRCEVMVKEKSLSKKIARIEAFVRKTEDAATIRESNERTRELTHLTTEDLMQQFTI